MSTHTESDLARLFAHQSTDVADAAQLTDRLQTVVSHRHPRAMIAMAVAATVALTVAVPTEIHAYERAHPRGNPAAAKPTAPPKKKTLPHTLPVSGGVAFTYTAIVAPSGTAIGNRGISDTSTFVEFGNTHPWITVYSAGNFDSAAFIKAAQRVRLDGHDAYFFVLRYTSSGPRNKDGSYPEYPQAEPEWAWPVGDGRWVEMQSNSKSPELNPTTVAAVQPFAAAIDQGLAADVRVDVTVPIRVGWLPAGLQRSDAATVGTPGDKYWYRSLTFAPVTGTKASQQRQSITISIQHNAMALGKPNEKINGYNALYQPSPNDQLELFIGDVGVIISGRYSKDALKKIAASITVAANVDDESTWFDTMQ